MKSIIEAAESAESLSQSFAVRVGNFEQMVTEKEARALAAAKRYGTAPGEVDQGTLRLVQQATRNAAKREASDYHRTLVANTETERIDRLKTLKDLDSRAIQLEPLYESPVQLLSRVGLGSPERSRYQEQLASAGPRELKNHADWAVAQGDRILAAAVLSRLDTLPRDSRPIQAAGYADSIVGEECRQMKAALRRTRVAVQHSINVNRDFERGRVDSVAKIGMGLARRQA